MKNDTNVSLSLDELAALLARQGQEETVHTEEDEAREDGDSLKFFLNGLISSMLKYWWVIAITMALFAGVMIVLLSTQAPKYKATVFMYARNRSVTSAETELNLQEIANAEYYINMYGEYLKMDMPLENILTKLTARYGDKYADIEVEDLYDMISIGSRNKTPLLYVSITDTDPQRAVDLIDVIRRELPEQLKELSGLEEAPVKAIDWTTDASEAETVSKQTVSKVLLAAIVGFLISAIFVCIKGCLIDDSIESAAWLSENFKNIPVLAEIPDIKQSGSWDADAARKE